MFPEGATVRISGENYENFDQHPRKFYQYF